MSGMVARLDDWGRPAWFAAMIIGFVLFWPIGLTILGYMIWSGRMGCGYAQGFWGENRQARWERKMERMREKMDRWQQFRQQFASRRFDGGGGFAPSGNRAFDEYRADTIRRLEDEAGEFRDFLERLRHAKDKAEFDQFMADRRERPAPPREEGPGRDGAPRPHGA